MRRLFARLKRNNRAVTIIEFALVCPVMLILIMGLAEIAFQGYLQSILTGAVQKAARDSTIEGNGSSDAGAAIDAKVKAQIALVMKGAVWDDDVSAASPVRQNFAHFADIGPEYYWDNNPANGKYDASTECFLDSNGNGVWDADPSVTGQGGANAIVVYQMGFSYPRLFPLFGLLGWSSTGHISAETILKNQPYKYQNTADDTLVCPKNGKTS